MNVLSRSPAATAAIVDITMKGRADGLAIGEPEVDDQLRSARRLPSSGWRNSASRFGLVVRRNASTMVLVAMLLVALTACGDVSRPSVEEWRTVWNSVVNGIPTAAELGQPPDRSVCTSALAMLRERSQELFPTPDLAVDSVVREWVRIAQDAFFECPPSSAQIPSLEFALGELDRLEAEVEVVLDIDKAEE